MWMSNVVRTRPGRRDAGAASRSRVLVSYSSTDIASIRPSASTLAQARTTPVSRGVSGSPSATPLLMLLAVFRRVLQRVLELGLTPVILDRLVDPAGCSRVRVASKNRSVSALHHRLRLGIGPLRLGVVVTAAALVAPAELDAE